MTHPRLLDGVNCKSQGETTEGEGVWTRSPTRSTLEVEGVLEFHDADLEE